MKKIKRAIVFAVVSFSCLACLCACKSRKDEERIKSAEEIAIEQKHKAEDAVELNNEQVEQFNESVQQVDE